MSTPERSLAAALDPTRADNERLRARIRLAAKSLSDFARSADGTAAHALCAEAMRCVADVLKGAL